MEGMGAKKRGRSESLDGVDEIGEMDENVRVQVRGERLCGMPLTIATFQTQLVQAPYHVLHVVDLKLVLEISIERIVLFIVPPWNASDGDRAAILGVSGA
jgi:hypothetical protein